jgi:hypothetical protein
LQFKPSLQIVHETLSQKYPFLIGGVAQSVGLEFKSQCHTQKKNQKPKKQLIPLNFRVEKCETGPTRLKSRCQQSWALSGNIRGNPFQPLKACALLGLGLFYL